MKAKICIAAIVLSMAGNVDAWSQRRHVNIPDLPGYVTLKADMHTHTIFSDGRLWPDARVEEAWKDGLDVIALTDHSNYRSPIISKYLVCDDLNAAYDEALDAARQLGMTLIKGSEVTLKGMGDFNVYFIDDLNDVKVVDGDGARSLRIAKEKGAFIQWNHPLKKWSEKHEALYQEGIFRAIEVYNYDKVYEHACKWADERDMFITCGSDTHNLTEVRQKENHRPMTLIFAKENTPESIREAMEDHRTAIYYADTLMGHMKHLAALFDAGVSIRCMPRVPGKKKCYIQIDNTTDINFTLDLVRQSPDVRLPKEIRFGANKTTQILMFDMKPDCVKTDPFLGVYRVKNCRTLSGKHLEIELRNNEINVL